MKKIKYLVLLRSINVGGKNIIKMDALRELLAECGFDEVQTYIQSGNAVFKEGIRTRDEIKSAIEKALYGKLNTKVNMAVLTLPEMKKIITAKPLGFGEDDEHKYDVIFMIEPLKAREAVNKLDPREGVDRVYEGEKVLYISRSIKNISKSRLSMISESPIYQNITVRNWNTTVKLYELMAENA